MNVLCISEQDYICGRLLCFLEQLILNLIIVGDNKLRNEVGVSGDWFSQDEVLFEAIMKERYCQMTSQCDLVCCIKKGQICIFFLPAF